MLPTPSTSHVNYDRIYEPSEDSYLLLDTISSATEASFLSAHFPPSSPSPLVIEVGVGSGVVIAFVTAHALHIFGRADITTLGTDVNRFACEASETTVATAVIDRGAAHAGRWLGCVNSDLVAALRPEQVDVLIFNPPYVPSEALPTVPLAAETAAEMDSHERFERDSHLLALSYAGGADGMETTDRLLDALPETLSARGIGYVLLCAQNRPEAVIERIRSWPGRWSAEIVGRSGKKAGWEQLCVVRIWRTDPS